VKLLLKGGRVVDPSSGLDEISDILIIDGKINSIDKNLDTQNFTPFNQESFESILSNTKDLLIDLTNKIVAPGFIDMHTHLRSPGREDEETIESGTMAAVAGGFTSIVCMANTDPVNDSQSVTEFILSETKKIGKCNVFPVGAVTKELKGESLAEIGEMYRTGIVALSDDGKSIPNAEIFRRGLEYASMFGLTVICHCEDPYLKKDGVMHEGYYSTILGLPGVPRESEEFVLFRNALISKMTSTPIHIAHISSRGSIDIIERCKSQGIKITAECCPHYFLLSDKDLIDYDTNKKVNPPIRDEEDQLAILEALKKGLIDVIASDHAPHASQEKELDFINAPSGMIGLETTVPLSLTRIYHQGILNLKEFIEKFTLNPARILKINKGILKVGSDADITILDIDREWTVKKNDFYSKSRNTPFDNWKVKGKPFMTIVGGSIKMFDGIVI
jgi:dihydroorotase